VTSARLTVAFEAPTAPRRLLWERHPGHVEPNGSQRLRLYGDHAGASVFATHGSLSGLYAKGRQVVDLVTFNGSDTASPQYPPAGLVTFAPAGTIFTVGGAPGGVSFAWDATSQQFRASAPCYGMLSASYSATYRLFNFKSSLTNADAQALGSAGMVGAIKDQTVATFSPSLGEPPVSAPVARRRLHLASVTSEQIAAFNDSRWEKPDGWPESNTFPNGERIPGRGGTTIEVVWDTIWLLTDLQWYPAPQIATVAAPYGTDPAYKPKRTLKKVGTPPPDWSEYYQHLVWSGINDYVSSRYPGIQL